MEKFNDMIDEDVIPQFPNKYDLVHCLYTILTAIANVGVLPEWTIVAHVQQRTVKVPIIKNVYFFVIRMIALISKANIFDIPMPIAQKISSYLFWKKLDGIKEPIQDLLDKHMAQQTNTQMIFE